MRPESRKYGRSRVPGYVVRCTARSTVSASQALRLSPSVHRRADSEGDSTGERLVGRAASFSTDRQVLIDGVSERSPQLHDGLPLKGDYVERIDYLAVEDSGVGVEVQRRPVSVILHHGFCPSA